MATDQTRNVPFTAEPNAFIRAHVAASQNQNASEVVQAGLRLLKQNQRQEPTLPSSQARG